MQPLSEPQQEGGGSGSQRAPWLRSFCAVLRGLAPKHTALALVLTVLCTSCVSRPYYGRSIVQEQGRLLCGLHRVEVKVHQGYLYHALISFTDDESRNFADERFPNTLVATFSGTKSKSYPLPTTDYTCPECIAGWERLDRLPMWYKRIAGFPAKMQREREITRAAKKARQTGNPEDARVPAGDGYLSRVP